MNKMFLKISLGVLALAGLSLTAHALAPTAPWGTALSVMSGSNPNGSWSLYVQDDKSQDVGVISNGWQVTLTTANPVGYAADNQLYATPVTLSLITNTYWTVNLAVTNYGPSSSSNVVVTDTLPLTGVTLVSSNVTLGSVSVTGNTLTWTVGNLAINTGAGLTLSFLATTAGTYVNDAIVSAATSDPNADDDEVISTLVVNDVVVPPQLKAQASVAPGAFSLSVTNSPGQTVIIQASTNLLTWTPVSTNVVPFAFTNFDSSSYQMRFYRAVVSP